RDNPLSAGITEDWSSHRVSSVLLETDRVRKSSALCLVSRCEPRKDSGTSASCRLGAAAGETFLQHFARHASTPGNCSGAAWRPTSVALRRTNKWIRSLRCEAVPRTLAAYT